MTTTSPARPRNAAATRDAILRSARAAFARSGYDGVGVREIAQGAGVTAMLINRYFGSKAELFAEVVADTMADPVVLSAENLNSPDLAGALATALVQLTTPGATPLDGFLILFHSASSPLAAEIGRVGIESHHHRALTAALTGDLAAERAALVLSLVAGLQVMRQMIGLTALTQTDPKVLADLLKPLIQTLAEGNEARP
jgi:AcrR family transcriptional regulator